MSTRRDKIFTYSRSIHAAMDGVFTIDRYGVDILNFGSTNSLLDQCCFPQIHLTIFIQPLP